MSIVDRIIKIDPALSTSCIVSIVSELPNSVSISDTALRDIVDRWKKKNL